MLRKGITSIAKAGDGLSNARASNDIIPLVSDEKKKIRKM